MDIISLYNSSIFWSTRLFSAVLQNQFCDNLERILDASPFLQKMKVERIFEIRLARLDGLFGMTKAVSK